MAPPDSGKGWRLVFLGASLAVLVIVVFAPVLRHDFLDWDDRQAVQHNSDFNPPRLQTLAHYWTGPHLQFYVPVTYTTWWLLSFLAHGTPQDGVLVLSSAPFHALNLLIHACNAVLMFAVLRRLVRHDWAAWLAAGLFALHPVQAEPVAWISSMYSSLSGLFALGATWLYLRFSELRLGRDPQVPPRNGNWDWMSYAAATGLYALSLLTKPTVIALPVVLALIDIGLRNRRPSAVTAALAPWLVLALPIILVTKMSHPAPSVYLPLWLRPFVAMDALTFYLYKLLLPMGMAPDYGRSPRWLAHNVPALYLAWLAPASLLIAALLLWRRTHWPFVALCVFVAALLPMLGLTSFDFQRYSTVADRYLYFALLAPSLLLAWVLSRYWSSRLAIGSGLVLAGLAILTFRQLHHWSDTHTLFQHTLKVNPGSLAAHSVFADLYAGEGKYNDALREYEVALRANPGDPFVLFNRANIHLRMGNFEQAIPAYREVLRSRNDARIYSNLGIALAQSGQGDEAVEVLGRALEIDPSNAGAHLNLANVMMERKQWGRARMHYESVLRLGGNAAAARRGLAALESIGR